MCSGGDTGPTSDAGKRAVDQHTGRSTGWLRGAFGGERTNGSKHKKGGNMCGNRSDDPDDYGPASFGPVRHHRHRGEAISPEDHRGLFCTALVLALTVLACGGGSPKPWPRDAQGRPEDPAVVSGRRRGLIDFARFLRDIPRLRRA